MGEERAELGDSARARMRSARELVDGVRGEHTYGVNTGFGRFVSESIPGRAGRGAPAAAAPQPRVRGRRALSRTRSSAPRCSCGRTRSPRGTRARGSRRSSCCSSASTAASSRTSRRAARSGRAATSRRSRISRCRSSARARPGSRASCCAGARGARARPGSSRCASQAKEGLSLDQRHAVHGRDGALGLVRARRLAADRRRRLRALARGAAGLADELPSRDPRARARCAGRSTRPRTCWRLLEGSAIIESHRWCDKVQDAYSLRCAPQVHGASRDLLDYVERHGLDRAQRGDRQPARPRRGAS